MCDGLRADQRAFSAARRLVRCAAALALCALAGCGSSGGGSTATTLTSTKTSTSGASLQVETTPKYVEAKSSEPVRSGIVNVAYRDMTIHPDVLRVKVGTIVKWTNYDNVDHNVTRRAARSASPRKTSAKAAPTR